VQNHFDELYRHLQCLLVSRDEFARIQAIPADTLTDIQRAVRFWYTIKCCFGGKYRNATFGISKTDRPNFNPETLRETLLTAHKRLARVYIECLPYKELILRYDSPRTLFYIDPPYYKMENYYGKDLFSREDFVTLNDILGQIKGKFIMSINDVPEIRTMFEGFNIKEVQTKYSVNANHNKTVGELLIMNY
jgi:DNA adenine methylase